MSDKAGLGCCFLWGIFSDCPSQESSLYPWSIWLLPPLWSCFPCHWLKELCVYLATSLPSQLLESGACLGAAMCFPLEVVCLFIPAEVCILYLLRCFPAETYNCLQVFKETYVFCKCAQDTPISPLRGSG